MSSLTYNTHNAYKQQPLVSICIPVYNAENTIIETIRSILEQTYGNMEILIVDNASTDNTPSLLKEFNDPRLKIYWNDVNIGAEGNFSKAVHLASGEYIGLFHADDLYLPEMVEKQVAAFQKYPSAGAVFTLANHINSRGDIIGESHLPLELKSAEIHSFPEIFEATLKNKNILMCPSAMVKGKLYKELIPFAMERFGTASDLDMWLRILEIHPIIILQEKLMDYRFSLDHGTYQLNQLRTEREDFFKVMDHYLSKYKNMKFSAEALAKYRLAENIDRVRCALFYLVKNEPSETKKLLKESFSTKPFWGFGGSLGGIRAHKVLICWLFALICVLIINLGLNRYFVKSIRRLMQKSGKLMSKKGAI